MDIFGEKRYDNLDWLTKACEPVTWSMMELIPKLPERYTLSDEEIIEAAINQRLQSYKVFNAAMRKAGIDPFGTAETLSSFYQLNFSEGLTVDLEKRLVYGTIELVRIKDHFEEKELIDKLKHAGSRIEVANNESSIERAKEILDLMGTETATNAKYKRSSYQLSSGLNNSFRDIMMNNRWNIRSIDLAERVCQWIDEYVRKGNLAAMRNFCILKAATHRGYPIYEIEEEEL